MTDPTDLTRGEVYRGLRSAMGRYKFVDAITRDEPTEHTHALDDEPLKPIVTWVLDGRDVDVRCHHVWGVGGGPTDRFTETRVRDRHLSFRGGEWQITRENQTLPEENHAL